MSLYLSVCLFVCVCVFVCVAAERAEPGGGGAAVEVVQPGGQLHHRSVSVHRSRAAQVPLLPHPQPRADRTGVRRVGPPSPSLPSTLVGKKPSLNVAGRCS